MVNKYYQKKQRKASKKIIWKYQNLSDEEKEKKRHQDWNKNLSEEEKQKKVEEMRNHFLAHKK